MKYLFLILTACSLIGCASIQVDRDSEGRITKIYQGGIMPVKGKIDNCELDSKLSLFDFNFMKE